MNSHLATLLLIAIPASLASAVELRTVAETSDFQSTASYAEVMQLCRELADRSDSVHMTSFGQSFEGRDLPLLVLAGPGIESAEQARASGKLVVLAIGNIHAGEVCGKEALLMLAREISQQDDDLLKQLVVLLAPIYNADGNERVAADHRPNQAGPANGVGQRGNAQGLDLNRDHVKLESPEARALAGLLSQWDPAVVIDTHTTNGSRHRYTLTYDAPRHPATDEALLEFARDRFLPEVGKRLEERTGYRSFFYGNFSHDRQRWETYPAQPRYSTHYIGLRNRIGILSEAYAYASYEDRVLVTLEFVRECLIRCAAEPERITELVKQADKRAKSSNEPVAIQGKPSAVSEKVTVLGYETFDHAESDSPSDGDPIAKDYELEFLGATESTKSVSAPDAYLIPASFEDAVRNLLGHGVACEELREDIELDIEAYRVDDVERAEQAFQNHRTVTLRGTAIGEARQVPAGTIVVRTSNPLKPLIVNLLEAETQDGLVTWNFFDREIGDGQEFPVVRLPRAPPLLTAPVNEASALEKKPITFETVYGEKPVNFAGSPASGFQWLDDGEHFLWSKSDELHKVDAVTGRCHPFLDRDKLASALAELPTIDHQTAERFAKQTNLTMNPQRTGALFAHKNDLYFADFGDKPAIRLTSSPEVEELASFSPDGRFVAFVQDFDLHVVDIATRTERALTTGGTTLTRNAKADWVYFEEINHRDWRAYAWSPDSRSIVFQHFDDRAVPDFALVNNVPGSQTREITPYPRAGDPNPHTKLGVVDAAGGDVRWIDLSGYSADDLLISGFGWAADSQHVFCFAQNRSQQWLDYLHADSQTGTAKRLFRDRTQAWIEPLAKPHYLKDGSFLWQSERSGWRHLYHYAAEGELRCQLTDGPWEVRRVHEVDEEGGWIYFSGTRDSHLAENLYRVGLTGSQLTCLTLHHGDHRVSVAPKGRLFIDSCSDVQTPTRVALYRGDGQAVRTIDTNPVRELDEYQFGKLELLKIKTRDGQYLEASLLKPVNFDPSRKYPVWVTTYAGPHAPTMRLSWNGGRTFEQLLAQMGILAFRVDPHSASGKGAVSAWPAYRQLGVRELADLEDAVDWLNLLPYVDSSRIGLSGHSYGGFMTAYAMTHSKLFAAGISGAPVTDWRSYDTIYTERYMDTPQENAEGYQKTSVVEAASQLHGRLLILHGAVDDNVHVQNTMQLVDALQKANRQFELMIYPQSRHGLHGSHYRRLMVDFIRRTMLE